MPIISLEKTSDFAILENACVLDHHALPFLILRIHRGFKGTSTITPEFINEVRTDASHDLVDRRDA
jgi:hypothetical protein